MRIGIAWTGTVTGVENACFCTANGMDAVEKCRLFLPDVLLLGGALPSLDGRGVIARLKARPPEKLPAVIGAGWHDFDCAAHVDPPLTWESILAVVSGMKDEFGEVTRHRLLPDCAAAIPRALDRLGVPLRLRGRACMEKALSLLLRDGELAGRLTTRLYPLTGTDMAMTAKAVERNVRTAVENAWETPRYEYFGNLVDPARGMPTNGEFLSRVAEAVRLGEFDRKLT